MMFIFRARFSDIAAAVSLGLASYFALRLPAGETIALVFSEGVLIAAILTAAIIRTIEDER